MHSVWCKSAVTLLPGFTEFIAKGNFDFYKQKHFPKANRKNDQASIWGLCKKMYLAQIY